MKDRGYEYIISGVTYDCRDDGYCMVKPLANGTTKKRAKEILKQMLENPTEYDKRDLEGFDVSTLKITKLESWQCWWNDPVMSR